MAFFMISISFLTSAGSAGNRNSLVALRKNRSSFLSAILSILGSMSFFCDNAHKICAAVLYVLFFAHQFGDAEKFYVRCFFLFRYFYIERFMPPIVQNVGDLKPDKLIFPIDLGFLAALFEGLEIPIRHIVPMVL